MWSFTFWMMLAVALTVAAILLLWGHLGILAACCFTLGTVAYHEYEHHKAEKVT